jgi:hypothetical protein
VSNADRITAERYKGKFPDMLFMAKEPFTPEEPTDPSIKETPLRANDISQDLWTFADMRTALQGDANS